MTPSREAIPSGILPVKWLDESSSSDEEYPRAVLYHHRKIAEHVHELYELGYKTLIRGSAVGMKKMAKKKNKSDLKLSPPSTSPRKVVKAKVTRKIPRAPPPIALGDHHHLPCVLWH